MDIPEGVAFPAMRDALAREGGLLLVSVLCDMLAGHVRLTPSLSCFHFEIIGFFGIGRRRLLS